MGGYSSHRYVSLPKRYHLPGTRPTSLLSRKFVKNLLGSKLLTKFWHILRKGLGGWLAVGTAGSWQRWFGGLVFYHTWWLETNQPHLKNMAKVKVKLEIHLSPSLRGGKIDENPPSSAVFYGDVQIYSVWKMPLINIWFSELGIGKNCFFSRFSVQDLGARIENK